MSLLQTSFELQRGTVKETAVPGSAHGSDPSSCSGEVPGDVLDQLMDEDDLSAGDSLSLMQTSMTHQRGLVQEMSSPYNDMTDEDEMGGLEDAMRDWTM